MHHLNRLPISCCLMRLFISAEIPERIQAHLARVQRQIENKYVQMRLADARQLHITLKFLGEIEPSLVEKAKRFLASVSVTPFDVSLGSMGVFPNEKNIRVVWVGLVPAEPIIQLQKRIDDRLSGFFERERDFVTHITLARVKSLPDRQLSINVLKRITIIRESFTIQSFSLMESMLGKSGPVYRELARYPA
jgi:RNA 2',3'-cyclic 3'-phosphodiesterase